MRLKASFSALGVLAFLMVLHIDWSRPVDASLRERGAHDEAAVEHAPLDQARLDHGQVEISRCRSSIQLIETTRYYDFFGRRERDADQSLRQRLLVSQDFSGRTKRFAGQTDWHIDWYPCMEPRGAGCLLGGVAAIAYVTYTLPRWADRAYTDDSLGGRWDRYAHNLQMHERGHGVVARQIAALFEHELVGLVDMERCEEVGAEASRRVESIIRRGEAMQNEYDRLTEHGKAQGAVFPF